MTDINDLEKEVTIKLKKWQVEKLLGAARLGIWAEDWCAGLIQTSIGTYDSHSGKWILRVGYIIEQIKEQTGVYEEDKEYGEKGVLEAIDKWVDEQCELNIKHWSEYEVEEYGKHKKEQEIKKEHNNVQKVNDLQSPKPITVRLTKNMQRKVMEFVEKIKKEKK